MEKTTTALKQLRARFVSDFNLPIQVIHSPYFEDRLVLLEQDYQAKSKYDRLMSDIDKHFNGNTQKFLEYYYNARESVIKKVINTDAYKKFIGDNFDFKSFKPIIGKRQLYSGDQDGCLFFSYDMKQANFQAVKYAYPQVVFDADSYEDFIDKCVDDKTMIDYVKASKYTREVVFGQMSPKRTIHIEKEITNEFAKMFIEDIASHNDKICPFSIENDELIFKFIGTEEEFNNLEFPRWFVYNGVKFKLDKFKLHLRQFSLSTSDAKLTVYEKEDYLNGRRRVLKGVPASYFPQVYKLLGGMKLSDSDLVFYYEHQLCKFLYPIELEK